MGSSSATPSPASRALFVSYASQDAVEARRIFDALHAEGVEVWFDQSGLDGGDAWDRKIRGQIRGCALFLPVISQNTNARREGYFRREWKLAVDRTHDMDEALPFLIPVVIDATTDAEAHVPEKFREVQWTRLLGGETSAAFCTRVKNLLGGVGASVVAGVADPGPASTRPATAKVDRALRARLVWSLAVAAGIILGIFGWSRLHQKSDTLPPSKVSAPEKPTAPRLGPKSIAVLPFDNLGEDKDANAFFADGMHEDLITNLMLIRELRCVPRTTAMTYRGTKKTHREIAEELGVAYVLTGTVRRAEKKVRITGTLINARTDEPLWSKPYDKDITDAGVIFAIQSELAQAIAGELQATLSPQEKKLVERRPTGNAAAYDLFLQARELRNGWLGGRPGHPKGGGAAAGGGGARSQVRDCLE